MVMTPRVRLRLVVVRLPPQTAGVGIGVSVTTVINATWWDGGSTMLAGIRPSVRALLGNGRRRQEDAKSGEDDNRFHRDFPGSNF
jgi:hypothetical protein